MLSIINIYDICLLCNYSYAAIALSSTAHQTNIKDRLSEIKNYVDKVTSSCQLLFDSSSQQMPISESELTFEVLDENIHMLVYRIDHTVRILQGSETDKRFTIIKPRFDNSAEVERICQSLDASMKHILDHAKEDVTPHELVELHEHLEELKELVDNLHGHVDIASRKWRRSQPFPDTQAGDSISIGLVLPVCIDSMVDGFVIGIAASTSIDAGIVMALVNSMEMSFL